MILNKAFISSNDLCNCCGMLFIPQGKDYPNGLPNVNADRSKTIVLLLVD